MRDRFMSSGIFIGALLLLGCGNDGAGGSSVGGGQMLTTRSSVSDGFAAAGDVLVAAGTGVSGLYPGTGANNLRDGWTVEYRKILVKLGEIMLRETSDGDLDLYGVLAFDLQSLPPGGAIVAQTGARRGPASVDFLLSRAAGAYVLELEPYISAADAEMMRNNGYSIYIEGTIERSDGRSCTPGVPGDCVPAPVIEFRWGLPAGAVYRDCVWDDPAKAAPDYVTLTLPAYHWLRTTFDPDNTQLRAQWIADADLDRDGETTLDELRQIDAATLFTPRRGYDLSGARVEIDTAYDFVLEQARMIGRNAWGKCGTVDKI